MNRPASRREKNSLPKPFIALVVYFSLEYVRWHTELPFVHYLKLPGLLTYGLLAWFLLKGDKSVIWKVSALRWECLLLAYMTISIIWAIHTSAFWVSYGLLVVFCAIITPFYLLVDDHKKLMIFFKSWVVMQALVSLIVIRNGGLGSGSFLFDENDVSLCLGMAIPYAYYVSVSSSISKTWKWVCRFSLLIIVAGVVVSFSRGGFLGMVMATAAMLLLSEKRIRNILLSGVAAIALGGVVLLLLPQGYLKDMETISDPNNSTRVERLNSWEIGWIMFKDNPVLGVGVAQYAWNVERYERQTSYWISELKTKSLMGREAHSLYFSLIPDLGLVGIVLFSAMIAVSVRTLRKIIKSVRKRGTRRHPAFALDANDDLVLLAKAMAASMVCFFVSGAFVSVLYYPHIWYLVAFIALLGRHFDAAVATDKATK